MCRLTFSTFASITLRRCRHTNWGDSAMKYQSILVFLMIGSLLACAHGSKMQKLRPDMTRQEVIKILGQPDGFKRCGDYESLKYANKLMSGWAWDRADYFAILLNGKLVEYGVGEIRVKENNTIVLIPLK